MSSGEFTAIQVFSYICYALAFAVVAVAIAIFWIERKER